MMTLDFIISEEDYHEYYMFTVSRSQAIKDRRFRSWIIVTGAFAALGSVFYWDNNRFMASYMAILAIISLFLYPSMMRNGYEKYIRKQILPLLKHNFGKPIKMAFETSYISWQHFAGESKTYYSALVEINETANHFFIPLQTGNIFIIPKFSLTRITELETYLARLASETNIPYNKLTDKKWSKEG